MLNAKALVRLLGLVLADILVAPSWEVLPSVAGNAAAGYMVRANGPR